MENDVLYNRIMNQVLKEYGMPGERVRSINAVYTQSGIVYDTDSLDSLKADLVVTAIYNDSTTETVPSTDYTLSGTLEVGISTITVSYRGKITTFTVNVTEAVELVSISAVYTQSGTVYDTDSLDSLKTDLVVTATYSDSTTETVPSTDYTLSGTLEVGISTITVSYGGKTATFNVTVSENLQKMSYSYSDGDLIKQNAGVTWTATLGAYLTTQQAHNRRTFVLDHGELPLGTSSDGSTVSPSDYYPIPIPADATSISVSITPNTQFFGPALYTYDGTKYTRTNDVGWQQGAWSLSFTAGTYDYATFACKYNSAGNNYSDSTEPTDFNITFA